MLLAVIGLMIPTPFISVMPYAEAQDTESLTEVQLYTAEKFAETFLIDPLSAVSWFWNIADWVDTKYDKLVSAIGSELPVLEKKVIDCVNYRLNILELEAEGKDHFDPELMDADEKYVICLVDLNSEANNFADSDDLLFWDYVIVMHWALKGNDLGLKISGLNEFAKDFQDLTGIDATKIQRDEVAVEASCYLGYCKVWFWRR